MRKRKKRQNRIVDPNSFDFIGVQYLEKPEVQIYLYNSETHEIINNPDLKSSVKAYQKENLNFWFNIHGIHDKKIINNICRDFNIQRFVIRDILDTTQRARISDFEEYLFINLKSILPADSDDIAIEQISFVLGYKYLLTFQERVADHFNHIRERIKQSLGFSREKEIDYLLYLLLDAIIDNYRTTLEQIDPLAEQYSQDVLKSNSTPALLEDIEDLKENLFLLKKSISPIYEALGKIDKDFSRLISPGNIKYFNYLKEKCLHIIDDIDINLNKLDSAANMYFSIQGHKMNEIMKTLTIIASIFIPLTFIAGLYGMNFDNMPELRWHYGYFGALGLMAAICLFLVYFFKKKRWF